MRQTSKNTSENGGRRIGSCGYKEFCDSGKAGTGSVRR